MQQSVYTLHGGKRYHGVEQSEDDKNNEMLPPPVSLYTLNGKQNKRTGFCMNFGFPVVRKNKYGADC